MASQPRTTGEYFNGWFIHTCKLDLTLFTTFLYVYISCGCLTRCLNSKRLNSKRLNSKRLNSKRLNSKRLNSKRLNSKRLNSKRLNSKRLNSKRLNSKRLNSKRLNSKRLNSKRLNSKRLNSKRLNSKRLNSKRSSSTRGNTTEKCSRCPSVCATVLTPRERFIFLTTRRRSYRTSSSSDLSPGYQVVSGAQKAHSKEQLHTILYPKYIFSHRMSCDRKYIFSHRMSCDRKYIFSGSLQPTDA